MRLHRPSSTVTLTALVVGLVAAFVLGPPVLAGVAGVAGVAGFVGEQDLTRAVRAAFVEFWRIGDGDRGLSGLTDFWVRFHVVKAVFAAALLAVLIPLGVRLWRSGRRKALIVPGGVLVTALGLLSLLALMANVQGAVAPFSSLLPMAVAGASGEPLTGTLGQIRERLAAGDRSTPAVQAMIGDFGRYHEAMVVIAAAVAAGLIAVSVLLWRRFARAGASSRRVLGSYAVLTAVVALGMLVLAAANTSVAADPAPALLAFFQGGW